MLSLISGGIPKKLRETAYAVALEVAAADLSVRPEELRFLDMLRSAWTTTFSDKTVRVAFARETQEELQALKEMIEEEQLKSIVDTVYPMASAAEAHHRVETEQRAGAIVLSIAG